MCTSEWVRMGLTFPSCSQTPSFSTQNVNTVHKDLADRLDRCNHQLYLQVKQVLDVNKAERHIRGGIATRNKYKGTQAG